MPRRTRSERSSSRNAIGPTVLFTISRPNSTNTRISSTDEVKQLKEDAERLKEEMNREDANPEEIREKAGDIQKRSLSLFEAAYKKKMAENEANSGSEEKKEN